MAEKDMIEKIKELMYNPNQIRNIGTVAHIDHGKTTFSDHLLAGSGIISKSAVFSIVFIVIVTGFTKKDVSE